MLKTILRAIVYTITYPFRRAVTTVETFTLPPGTTPEEAAEIGKFLTELHSSPTATDDYRNPPPPWAAGAGVTQ